MAPLDASKAASPPAVEAFIIRWDGTAMAERANAQLFLAELCDVLAVPRPDPATGGIGPYRFERNVTHHEADGTATTRRIDLYRRACFVCEAKQGSTPHRQTSLFTAETEAQHRANVRNTPAWVRHMQQAKGQAEGYARDLPPEEGWPPFLIVCDVGFCLDLYADFSGMGKHYAQFPDRERFRIYLPDLRRPEVRDVLRQVWLDPKALNPALRRAEVTRDIAALLAKLAAALEGTPARPRHAPKHVATFLMRCIFCMFAQSVGLLPDRASFSGLLARCRGNLPAFVGLVGELWRAMDAGGFSAALTATVLRFNGGLFRPSAHGPAEPLAVTADELDLLITAANKDWAEVEPAIFGTLLEKALDAKERGRLGAQFTPRAFVERLVLPTVMEPLRADWDGVRAAAEAALQAGDARGAAGLVRAFHSDLCHVRVLDPACGTGNFLYVTLELMKRLEGEVLDTLAGYACNDAGLLDLAGATVDPHQFLGIDVNPRAVPVAELVLWIGYLQWHFRTNGKAPPAEPILRDFRTIQEGDALLSYTRMEADRDSTGRPLTRWGGHTTIHPITGEHVPDLTDQVLVLRPVEARTAPWPEAEFIVGNPPFIGTKRLRDMLGSGYMEALWAAHPKVPRSTDFVMFWWHRASELVASGRVRRFGFITPNSLTQFYNRRVVESALTARKPISLTFAIADHPWSSDADAAAVRIAMTVCVAGRQSGLLYSAVRELAGPKGDTQIILTSEAGTINAALTVGTDPTAVRPLRANERLCWQGCKLVGAGFQVSPSTAAGLLRQHPTAAHMLPQYWSGNDLMGRPERRHVIDFFGLSEDNARRGFPALFQHISVHVRPEREANRDKGFREHWWLFGRPRPDMRKALQGCTRYIATSEVAKHRIFTSLNWPADLADGSVIVIASSDSFVLGVLSSGLHLTWASAVGGTLEDRPRYQNGLCFDPFPFPAATPAQTAEIAALAEELDALRKARLAAHPHLTLTGLYNVMAAIRAGQPLTNSERDVLQAGHVEVLRHLHDRLDAAVAAAYGWPANLPVAEIVTRLVALNRERAAEEAAGQVRWLRPAFQAPAELRRKAEQAAMDMGEVASLPAWPKAAPAQFVALRAALGRNAPVAPADLARQFRGASRTKVAAMLETLAALGQARQTGAGRWVA